MTAREVLDGIKDRLTKATPGPWKAHDTWVESGGYCATVLSGGGNDIDLRAWLPTFSSEPGLRPRNVRPDAEFIAAAPVDVARLTRAVEAVLATPHIEHGLDADTRFTNGYNEALNRIRAAIEDALNPKEGQ